MASETPTLSTSQATALHALVAGSSDGEAATLAGVTPRTVRVWLREPGFRDALAEARRESLRTVAAQLASASLVAVRRLRTLVEDDQTPGYVAVSAASKLIDGALRAAELDDIEARLAKLEQVMS